MAAQRLSRRQKHILQWLTTDHQRTRGMITSSHQGWVRALAGDKGNISHNLHNPRQHLCYVYASLSRLDFRGLLEKGSVVFEGLTGFLAVKKPTALMMHWWNGGRGGI
jgi:hypothetical protein